LISQLKERGFSVTLISSDLLELHEMNKKLGCSIFPADISRRITPCRDVLTMLKLVKLFRQNRYDIIHAHTPKAGLLGMVAAAAAGIKCRIYTCHGLPLESESGLKRRLLAYAERTSCALAHQVLVVSNTLSQKLKAYGLCRSSKMRILGDGSACGVDLSRFSPTAELIEKGKVVRRNHSVSLDGTVIGFVGRLVPDKGIQCLVESFARLYEQNPDIRLLVLGDFEPQRGRLPDETTEMLRSHPGIIHIGFTYEIEPYYAAMDIVTLPSRREGFGLTLIEAGAMGLPVVATNVTGCVDAVVDGRTGLLVPPDSVTALTNAIAKLLASPPLRREMGSRARKRVEDKFTSARLVDAHVRLYSEMLTVRT
jgi:glycosyltransferase involved in cell wall biosynthesis